MAVPATGHQSLVQATEWNRILYGLCYAEGQLSAARAQTESHASHISCRCTLTGCHVALDKARLLMQRLV